MKKIMPVFKKRWKLILVILIALGIALTIFLTFSQPNKKTETVTVKKGTLVQNVVASGQIKAKESVDLKFSTASKLIWLGVKKGDTVKRYQAVATLDRAQLEKNLKQKLLDYMGERWDFEQARADKNVKTDRLNDYTLTDAEKRIIEKAQFTLDRSVLDVEISDLALKQSVLYSPIEGTVTDIGDLVVGTQLSPTDITTKIIRIVNFSTLYFEAKVSEMDYGRINTGQNAYISIDAFAGKEYPAVVAYIGKEGIKSSGGSVNILTELTLEPFFDAIVPGLSGEAKITTSKKDNVFIIPKETLLTEKEKQYVEVMKGDKPVKKEVKIGLTASDEVEIVSGLSEGDRIIVPSVK